MVNSAGTGNEMRSKRLATYGWVVLAYILAVILWGAFVRATGSGAGCGSHWPLCNGEVIPRSPQVETMIEFAHRLTSGLATPLMLGLLVWAIRVYPRGHRVRAGAWLSLLFFIVEALIGAGLVRLELVADNASVGRAFAIAAHLLNTFILVALMTLTAWWASGGERLRLRGQGMVGGLLGLGLLGMMVLGTSGAVAALGDTLFPATSLAEGLRQDLSPAAHLFIRLRLLHPLIAVGVGVYLVLAATIVRSARPDPNTKRWARALVLLFFVQLGAGLLNVLLLAPIWMQLIHLLLADLVWIVLVLLSASALAQPAPQTGVLESSPAYASLKTS
jgi:heme A synthase